MASGIVTMPLLQAKTTMLSPKTDRPSLEQNTPRQTVNDFREWFINNRVVNHEITVWQLAEDFPNKTWEEYLPFKFRVLENPREAVMRPINNPGDWRASGSFGNCQQAFDVGEYF